MTTDAKMVSAAEPALVTTDAKMVSAAEPALVTTDAKVASAAVTALVRTGATAGPKFFRSAAVKVVFLTADSINATDSLNQPAPIA